MRAFFLAHPILDALRPELSWTHYRLLLQVDKPEARAFYETEAVNYRWSTRELERQIHSLVRQLLPARDHVCPFTGISESSRHTPCACYFSCHERLRSRHPTKTRLSGSCSAPTRANPWYDTPCPRTTNRYSPPATSSTCPQSRNWQPSCSGKDRPLKWKTVCGRRRTNEGSRESKHGSQELGASPFRRRH